MNARIEPGDDLPALVSGALERHGLPVGEIAHDLDEPRGRRPNAQRVGAGVEATESPVGNLGSVDERAEVVGDAALLFDVTDDGELVSRLSDLLANADRREEFSRKALKRSREYDWCKTARVTLQTLRESRRT